MALIRTTGSPPKGSTSCAPATLYAFRSGKMPDRRSNSFLNLASPVAFLRPLETQVPLVFKVMTRGLCRTIRLHRPCFGYGRHKH